VSSQCQAKLAAARRSSPFMFGARRCTSLTGEGTPAKYESRSRESLRERRAG
jgi:hypothetical protein